MVLSVASKASTVALLRFSAFSWRIASPGRDAGRDQCEKCGLTGALDGWGDPLIPRFDLVVFVVAPTEVRLQRLKDRETRHFAAANVAPGGWRHRDTEEFLDWASHYEDGSREGRSRQRQEAWLAELPCHVLRLDGTEPLPTLVDQIIRALENLDESATRRSTT